jgi:predicted nucleic acid-binding Zn ribbon protein
MNQQTESLANIWANRRAEDDKLGITYTFSEKALQAFAEKVQEAHTQSVIQVCAKTINDNLNEQDRKRRNKIEMLELFVIIVVMAAWAHWWYTQLH